MLNVLLHPAVRSLALLTILVLITLGAADRVGIKSRISNVVFETYIKIKPRESSGEIVFVDIDDISLSKVGQWPWPRADIAQMVTNIKDAGAKVIIFDGVIAEPDRTSPDNIADLLDENHPAKDALKALPNNDKLLAQAIEKSENFVAGFSHGSNRRAPDIKQSVKIKKDVKQFFLEQRGKDSVRFYNTAQFLPELQQAAAGNGSFMASADGDAVIRKTGLIFHDGAQIYPSLILEGLRVADDKHGFIKVEATKGYSNTQINEPFHILLADYKIPMGANGKIWVYFRDFTKDESVSAYKFLDETYMPDKTNLSDKVVFIASSAEGLMDLRATPLGMRPGVNVHMNAYEQILQNKYLIRPHTANQLELGAAFIVSIAIILLSFIAGPVTLALIAFSTSAGAFALSWMLFDQYGGLFDPVTPALIVIFIFIASSILSFLKTDQEKQQVRNMFGLYVSPDVMRDLEKNPDKLSLGGENKELSVMFTDIRKFTTISEKFTPEELINVMNDFLTAMTDIVMEHDGTVDKYMGDAMMAFWNAPKDVEDHARKSCITALKMQDALAPINEELKAKAQEGEEPLRLEAGIGVHTGICAVGNMGSRQRFAYSALGDAVNLASRLEGQTKSYGVHILISEDTKNLVPDMAHLELDLLRVKGKTQPVRVYALVGDEDVANSPEYKNLAESHNDMIKAYQSGDFKEALRLVEICEKMNLYDLEFAYDLYEARIKELIKSPPQNWNGVFIATTK